MRHLALCQFVVELLVVSNILQRNPETLVYVDQSGAIKATKPKAHKAI